MKISFTPKKKQKNSLEQAKIVSIDKISGRVGISLRNGLISSATYLYDINDLRVGASVLVGRVSNTYVIMNKVSNMPRAGVAYSLAAPATPVAPEPELEPGVNLYYSADGSNWTLLVSYDVSLEGGSPGLVMYGNHASLAYIDDFQYNSPAGYAIWNDSFTGDGGAVPDVAKWDGFLDYPKPRIIANELRLSSESSFEWPSMIVSKSVIGLSGYSFQCKAHAPLGEGGTVIILAVVGTVTPIMLRNGTVSSLGTSVYLGIDTVYLRITFSA